MNNPEKSSQKSTSHKIGGVGSGSNLITGTGCITDLQKKLKKEVEDAIERSAQMQADTSWTMMRL